MQRPLGVTLGVLGLLLTIGMAGIVAAAVREARLVPGAAPSPANRRRAVIASVVTLFLVSLMVYAGGRWWKVEAAGFAASIYRPLSFRPILTGNTLDLAIGSYDPGGPQTWKARPNSDLLPDHGHLMHLYAIRQPEMDAVFHLHPEQVSPGHLRTILPSMPPGTYKLYGDIVHATGFPETLTASLVVPNGVPAAPLSTEDASALPAPLSAGDLGPSYRLPDGYSMVWDKPADLSANTGYTLRFRLLDPEGKPATGMQPYLGMAGHAAFVKTDGTSFAHTHPDGSAAMPAMMLANEGPSDAMNMGDMGGAATAIAPVVEFPYGFPSAGRYRIFIQMKHAGVVETGVFDAKVR